MIVWIRGFFPQIFLFASKNVIKDASYSPNQIIYSFDFIISLVNIKETNSVYFFLQRGRVFNHPSCRTYSSLQPCKSGGHRSQLLTLKKQILKVIGLKKANT